MQASKTSAMFRLFLLWIVFTVIWSTGVFFFWLLMDFQFVMWALEQSEWFSRIVLWLRPLIRLITALTPPVLSLYLYRRYGTSCVIPTFVLGIALLVVSFVFGRIDTQGTIYHSLPAAIKQGEIKRARTLVLTVADRYGFKKDVQALIKAGIDVNARDDWGQTVLISATRWGEGNPNPLLIKDLIGAGVDVNAKESLSGDTALISLTRWGKQKDIDPQVVKILIQAGANVNAKDNYGEDALFHAARALNAEEIKALLLPKIDKPPKTKGVTSR